MASNQWNYAYIRKFLLCFTYCITNLCMYLMSSTLNFCLPKHCLPICFHIDYIHVVWIIYDVNNIQLKKNKENILWQQSASILLFLLFLLFLLLFVLLGSLLAPVADLQAGDVVQVCCKAELEYQDECSGCPIVWRCGGLVRELSQSW